ncbi:hypothetical protein J6590_088708 [Homalodisca vitripennis]|nr:hypothetical protein J6590_088708 [Homalodisca vitripennis]
MTDRILRYQLEGCTQGKTMNNVYNLKDSNPTRVKVVEDRYYTLISAGELEGSRGQIGYSDISCSAVGRRRRSYFITVCHLDLGLTWEILRTAFDKLQNQAISSVAAAWKDELNYPCKQPACPAVCGGWEVRWCSATLYWSQNNNGLTPVERRMYERTCLILCVLLFVVSAVPVHQQAFNCIDERGEALALTSPGLPSISTMSLHSLTLAVRPIATTRVVATPDDKMGDVGSYKHQAVGEYSALPSQAGVWSTPSEQNALQGQDRSAVTHPSSSHARRSLISLFRDDRPVFTKHIRLVCVPVGVTRSSSGRLPVDVMCAAAAAELSMAIFVLALVFMSSP